MKDLPNAGFSPETINIMEAAMEASLATLPEPVSSATVTAIAESILRSALEGVRDANVMQRIALIELQIRP